MEEVYRLVNEASVDIDAVDINGCTSLHLAAAQGHGLLVRVLLDLGAAVDVRSSAAVGSATPLVCAVTGEHVAIAERLLDYAADPNVADPVSGFTALHEVARRPGPAAGSLTKLLVAKGADIHRRDARGYNASWWAKEMDNSDFLAVRGVPEPAQASTAELLQRMRAEHAYGASWKGGSKKGKKGKKKAKKKKKK